MLMEKLDLELGIRKASNRGFIKFLNEEIEALMLQRYQLEHSLELATSSEEELKTFFKKFIRTPPSTPQGTPLCSDDETNSLDSIGENNNPPPVPERPSFLSGMLMHFHRASLAFAEMKVTCNSCSKGGGGGPGGTPDSKLGLGDGGNPGSLFFSGSVAGGNGISKDDNHSDDDLPTRSGPNYIPPPRPPPTPPPRRKNNLPVIDLKPQSIDQGTCPSLWDVLGIED